MTTEMYIPDPCAWCGRSREWHEKEWQGHVWQEPATATPTDDTLAEALTSVSDLLGDALVYLRPPAGEEAIETALPWLEAADKEIDALLTRYAGITEPTR